MNRYRSPEANARAHHQYCRVVDLKGGGKKTVCSGSKSAKPKLASGPASASASASGARDEKRGFAAKNRAAFGKKKTSSSAKKSVPKSNGSNANSSTRLPGEAAIRRVTEKNIGNAHYLATRSPGMLVNRTIETMSNKAGIEVYPRMLGKGSYGAVFEGELKSAVDFRAFVRAGGIVHRTGDASGITLDDDLAVKIQVVLHASELKNLERESRVHQHVTRFARSVAPVFHFAGFLPETRTYVTVTSLVGGGGSICSIADKKMTAMGFKKVEKAVMNLWGIGVLHGDLHCNNIMVDGKGNIKIIDFGRAIIIPKNARPSKVSEALNLCFQLRLREIGNEAIRRRVRAGNDDYYVMNKTGPGGWKILDNKFQYSNDVQALRLLWKKLPEAEKRKFVAAQNAAKAKAAAKK
jgi:hypothetical protein